jgi:alkylated DNA repair dioxygenase AlkB
MQAPGDDLAGHGGLPPGLLYRPEFLTADEEGALLAALATVPLAAATYKQYVARRRTASFGASVDFDARALVDAPAMPPWIEPLRRRIAAVLGVEPQALAHALITAYDPGAPLGWHRDAPQFEAVAGVSLAGGGTMRWRRFPPAPRAPHWRLELAPRSLYVMQGEARWGWQHAMAPARQPRVSITFRTLRPGRRAP